MRLDALTYIIYIVRYIEPEIVYNIVLVETLKLSLRPDARDPPLHNAGENNQL